MITKPRNIHGLTTSCKKKYLDDFLANISKKQSFELYEGPPEFLPPKSLIFIFQTQENRKSTKLRAIAKFVGFFGINGYFRGKQNKKLTVEKAVKEIEMEYKKSKIFYTDSHEDRLNFCKDKSGVRGAFVFNDIIEIIYPDDKSWIRKSDVTNLFQGKQPYAQGFPYRYLSKGMVKTLLDEVKKKACNKDKISKFTSKI